MIDFGVGLMGVQENPVEGSDYQLWDYRELERQDVPLPALHKLVLFVSSHAQARDERYRCRKEAPNCEESKLSDDFHHIILVDLKNDEPRDQDSNAQHYSQNFRSFLV